MPKKKTEKIVNEKVSDYFDQLLPKIEVKPKEPVITSITINPNGTIFGLADSKVYLYDDQSKTWKPY
jgi:hypothetical protein